jgi:4-amino-4-deoxy-L-arabinose transferase-like glycosyltransferase
MKVDRLPNLFEKRRYILLILTVFCLFLYLPGITVLPPFDRDESRFVQASKQMLETGNFIDIRFQNQPRYKKPVGIYWLQSAAVTLFASGDLQALWAYRLPSLLSAIAGVLLVFYFGEKLFCRRTAVLAAFLLAASILLVIEAHLAKTDAALFLCTVIAQGSLGIVYLQKEKRYFRFSLMFWLALAASILIKGPILPAICGLTIISLLVVDRNRTWLRYLRFRLGLLLVSLIVLPWLITIYFVSDGTFFTASIGRDLLAKVASGQESHGAWPGYYLLLATATLFPASLFLFPSLFAIVKEKKHTAVRFCLAWIVPNWLLLELVPTKLMHYILPLYPALTLLIAHRLTAPGNDTFFAKKSVMVAYLFWGLVGLALAGATLYAPAKFGSGIHLTGLASFLAALSIVAMGVFFIRQKAWCKAALATSSCAAILYGLLMHFIIPGLDTIWLSPRLAAQIALHRAGRQGSPVVVTGFTEPSLVFLLGTDTRFATGEAAARYLLAQKNTDQRPLAIVEKDDLPSFTEVFQQTATEFPEPVGNVAGLNYSNGHWKDFTLYAFPESRP